MNPLEQIAAVFKAEVAEQLDALAQTVESLLPLVPEARREPIERCMRVAHNIKGIAASVGYEDIRELAHATETALSAQQAEPTRPIEPACATVLEAITAMQQIAEGRPLGAEPLAMLVARLSGKKADARSAPAAASAPAAPSVPAEPSAAMAASVRVEAARLDKLMTYAGELLVTHARLSARGEGLLRLRESIERRFDGLDEETAAALSPLLREVDAIIDADRRELGAFGRLTHDLGAAMKQVRMMRLDGLGPAWRQLVRESAQQLGRKVELTIEVGEIEIDKYVLDRIRDPLIHILRNAVAHGVEPTAERAAKGKPETGRIAVRASLHGAQVRLEVSDDGRGLDEKRIGEAALRKGLIDQARLARLSAEEIRALIFEEGFSTAERVDQVSGRGVGLNVVKANVAQLGGMLRVSATSELGGASFELMLPVSVVSRKGLLVRAGGSVYALPIEHVQRTVRVALDSLEKVDGEPVVRPAGAEPIRLRRLAQLMGRSAEKAAGLTKVVILERGESQLGLAVDEVLREEEYVVKPLPRNLAGVAGVDGAVILADGALAVAVNVPDLFLTAASRSSGSSGSEGNGEARPARKRILVADDMLTARALQRSILEGAGYEVSLAADGEEAWSVLQREHFDVLVSDVQMPRLDGCALTERIRADSRLRDLPVVLVTSLSSPAEIAAGGKAGANSYLIKGQYESEKLLATLRRFV
jgi:two-component system chemotaxis sensor kinase CheA